MTTVCINKALICQLPCVWTCPRLQPTLVTCLHLQRSFPKLMAEDLPPIFTPSWGCHTVFTKLIYPLDQMPLQSMALSDDEMRRVVRPTQPLYTGQAKDQTDRSRRLHAPTMQLACSASGGWEGLMSLDWILCTWWLCLCHVQHHHNQTTGWTLPKVGMHPASTDRYSSWWEKYQYVHIHLASGVFVGIYGARLQPGWPMTKSEYRKHNPHTLHYLFVVADVTCLHQNLTGAIYLQSCSQAQMPI